jgi:hypothetical protein
VPANPVPRTQNSVPSIPLVPTVHVTPPPPTHPYEAALAFQRTLPQLRNSHGRFIHCTTTNMLHPAIFTPEGSPTGTFSSLPSSSPPSSPSSISFSEKPSHSKTPARSPALQPPPSLQPITHRRMPDHKGSLQWEGSTDDNLSPGQFLHKIENKIDKRRHTTEKLKINCLKNNIAYGSGADE